MRERKTVVLPVDVLDDPFLSPVEVVILAQILRFQPRIERFTVNGMDQFLNLSKNTIRKGLLKLASSGYLTTLPGNKGWVLNEIKICASEDQNLNFESSKSELSEIKICVSEREEERTKEEEKENHNIEYIYNNTIRVKDNEKEREIQEREKAEPEADDKPKPKRAVFVKPTREEVLAYCRERQSTVSSSAFYDFYESKGWMVGKNHMKDWKAAVRTWEQKDKQSGRYYVPAENRTDGSDDLPY